jgi:hypothetical protein
VGFLDKSMFDKKAYNKKWKEDNKEKISAYNKEYAQKNAQTIKANKKNWNLKNAEQVKENKKNWIKKNKESVTTYNRLYTESKYKNDPIFKLKMIERTRILVGLKGKRKHTSTPKLLGCNFAELKIHLEKQFKDGMKWSNMGLWHIDHIKPLASFDLTDEEQQKQAFHYTNQQPLWAIDNLKKGAKHG